MALVLLALIVALQSVAIGVLVVCCRKLSNRCNTSQTITSAHNRRLIRLEAKVLPEKFGFNMDGLKRKDDP